VAEEDGWQLVPIEPTEAMFKAGVLVECLDRGFDEDVKAVWAAMLKAAPVHPVEPGLAAQEVERLKNALRHLLERDERNTCQHEDTHRGGVIWEICCDCGSQWADDQGGRPEWKDPPEWVEARAALSAPRPAQTKGPTP
jgi:hypothetical protein